MSYVYFAQVGDYVKIGFSYRPEQRVKRLARGRKLIVPADLDRSERAVLIATIPDCECRDERRVQRHFAKYNVCGEWFRCTPAFLARLSRLRYTTVRQEQLQRQRERAKAKARAALADTG